jgi:dienelactone hydrolase
MPIAEYRADRCGLPILDAMHPPDRCDFHTCLADPRFSFGLLLPERGPPKRLLVVVHDSTREIEPCLSPFAAFAKQHDSAVLAPLFPAGVLGDGNEDGYKFLFEADIRYDQVLNAMVDQVAAQTGCAADGLLLHGYSGGGQFVHRYMLLHPARLAALVVGAPGEVTLLDDDNPWWAGVQDTRQHFGAEVDAAALGRVPICMLVGERDTETHELLVQPPSRFWPSDAERQAANRIQRLAALHRSLRDAGVAAHFELMPGASHGSGREQAAARARQFFAQRLR